LVANSEFNALLVARLESIFTFSEEEKSALLNLPMQVTDIQARQDIVREGDRPSRCCLLLEGLACTYKVTGRGKRQIMAFYIPGDVPDLQSLHLRVLDNSLGTVGACKVGFIQHDVLHEVCRRYPRITAAFWRETLIDGAIFREWIMNVGRREAVSRIAHLFCEQVVRFRAIGLAPNYNCDFPITQNELADAVGISPVHVNRTLQELRAAELIRWNSGELFVLNWRRLKEVADFDPTYLHLRDESVVD
jgi:CRP-like cAMP-binding protein